MTKYMHNDDEHDLDHHRHHHHDAHAEEVEDRSDTVDATETVSESDRQIEDGSYAQYHGHAHPAGHKDEETENYDTGRRRNYDSNIITDPHDGNTSLPPSTLVRAANRESATTTNSFDQVVDEIDEDMEVFHPVEEPGVASHPEPLPERHQDRLFSENTPAQEDAVEDEDEVVTVEDPEPEDMIVQEEESEGVHSVDEQVEHHEHVHHEVHEHHHYHGENRNEDDDGHEHNEEEEHEEAEAAERGLPSHEPQQRHHTSGSDTLPTLPPPPSFSVRGQRLSRNMGDALANVWDRFWAEDVRAISKIVRNRFSQLMPYIRRFLAHVVAFWGGITYIRRAIAAFVRLLKRDERVRELLERVGWASATTLKVFLSMCTMIFQAMVQMYYLMRDRVIPDARRVIPIVYYKAIVRLLALAQRSPWALVMGPFSVTFAIDADKVPDKYWLHDKLSVPRDDVTFASMHTLVQTMRDTVYRTRYGSRGGDASNNHSARGSEGGVSGRVAEAVARVEREQQHEGHDEDEGHEHHEEREEHETSVLYDETDDSTQVYTQMTDETPMPPPSDYSGKRHVGTRKGTSHGGKENRERPLSERTNEYQHGHEHSHGHEYHSADVISHGLGPDRTGNTITRY